MSTNRFCLAATQRMVLARMVLVVSLPTSSNAQGVGASADPDTVWGRPKKTTEADFKIDARQGTSQSRKTFKQDASVRVILTDVNPFLFNYRLEARGQTVAEASPASFFELAFGLQIPKATDTKGILLNAQTFAPVRDSLTATSCSQTADQEANEGVLEADRLETFFTQQVRAPAEFLSKSIAEPTQKYRVGLSKARDGSLRTAQIRGGALQADTALGSIVAAYQLADEALKSSVTKYVEDVRSLRQSLDDLIEMYPTCLPLRIVRIVSRSLAADTLWAKTLHYTVTARRNEAQHMKSTLSTIANEPSRFYVTLEVQRLRGPSDVAVTVSRQPLTANITPATTGTGDQVKPVKFDTVGRHHFNVGGRGRLSAATGIAWGQLPERAYGVVQRSVPTIDGTAPGTASFVVRTKDSPDRFVPMLFLNTNLCNRVFPECSDVPESFSLHAVFGVTPKALALSRFDYFGGVGVGLLGERLYVNAGLFIAPLEKLNGSVAPGGQLPAGQTAVSTNTTLARRFGAALSYRVAPW